jgi:hypothetical protein
MNKKLREAKIRVARRLLLQTLLVVAVIAGTLLGWAYIQRLNAAAVQAEITPIRELLIDAVRNTKTDAPVDPKTGDIYFPQARLYVPNNSSYTQLTYAYNPGDGADLTIANKTALNQGIASLYSAQGFYELFSKLPYLQACQRGVTVAYQQLNDAPEKELRQTVQLANGKTAYLYIERACPELHETAELLMNLKSY